MSNRKKNTATPATTPAEQPGTPSNEVLALRQQLQDANTELALALKVNAELTKEVERLAPYDPQNKQVAKVVGTQQTFVHNGITYGFAFTQMRYNGEVVTHDRVLTDERLQAELVSMGSGMIKRMN